MRGMLDAAIRKTLRRIRRKTVRISRGELYGVFNELTPSPPAILMVHSSLSSCGTIVGGPDVILEVLQAHCETLVLPTHTYCYPDSPGVAGPLFDPATTPSKVGLISERFRKRQGILRSLNATHSIAASGPQAEEICQGHCEQDTPCGKGTPYERMIQHRAAALMFGVSMHSYTFFHTAEDAASDLAYETGVVDRLRVRGEDGQDHECSSRRQSRDPRRFRETGAMLEREGLLTRQKLGLNELLWIPDCRAIHEFLLPRLKRHPDFLFQRCSERLE
jgi:aminoglycoside 3-N-acetyltransferase